MLLSIDPIAPLPATPTARFATREHAAATLHGLQPGIYTARDLYARYLSLCDMENLRPAGSNHFGRHLAALGCQRTKTPDRLTCCWIIPAS